ncbi:hypothetical protein PB918_004901, partial [Salmonella enterica]|nr:hypothetical protein [Salmonella enterica]
TTVSTDRSAANADNKETITVTLTPRDSHNNVVPLWTFRKDLTIVPSVNATVPGAVTVTTPAQDAAGNVAATLTYVDTSGQLLSKAARTGTTSVSIGSAVKKTFDTRFYPQVHVCVSNLSASGYIVPGQTEVQICDGSGHAVPNGSGYTVTLPGMSSAGCTRGGGGVCPPDTAGVKADFTGLTGDDIAKLVFNPPKYDITDTMANVNFTTGGPGGLLAYYGELASHFPTAPLGGKYADDIFHIADAKAFCGLAKNVAVNYTQAMFAEALNAGTTSGGSTSQSTIVKSLYIGRMTGAITTGGDTNPELFVAGGGIGQAPGTVNGGPANHEQDGMGYDGTYFPRALYMVNGKRGAAIAWTMADDSVWRDDPYTGDPTNVGNVSLGWWLTFKTGWNLSDMYYVNNWPGTPLTLHKPDEKDDTDRYVTQVNYVTGYVCEASLQ